MIRRVIAMAMLVAGGLGATPALADENIFAYSYGSETLPKGATEAYVWITDRRDKNLGEYNAQDYQLELEHGLGNNFQGSVYLTFQSNHIKGLAPELADIDRNFAFNGAKGSLKWALSSPYTSPIGVAVYIEPGFSRFSAKSGERQTKLFLESKLLLQKNFLDDKLVWVGNITAEQEFKHKGGGEWESELELEGSSGLAYNIAPGLHLGGELRYTSAYEDFPNEFERSEYALFAGPTIHYATRKWWGTLSFQQQVSGGPHVRSSSLNLADFTRREVRLKLGYNF